MSALGYVALGAGGMFLLGLLIACWIESEVRDALARVVFTPIVLPVLALVELGMRLPKFTRRRVTADSLRAALDDRRYDQRTLAINSPRGALVLLRSKRREAER